VFWAYALGVCFGGLIWGCVLGVYFGRMFWAYALGVCFQFITLEHMSLGASLWRPGFWRMSLDV